MTLRPCIVCGLPTQTGRCAAHSVVAARTGKLSARARGYDAAWDRLSRRARRMQPFCEDCGATTNLQCDHTPQAWARRAAGQKIRLQDVAVRCGDCNIKRGAARGNARTRGDEVAAAAPDPSGKAESPLHTPRTG